MFLIALELNRVEEKFPFLILFQLQCQVYVYRLVGRPIR